MRTKPSSIAFVDRRRRRSVSFAPAMVDYEWNRMTRTPDFEEEILKRVEGDPSLSTRSKFGSCSF